jgi:hypothetical protein
MPACAPTGVTPNPTPPPRMPVSPLPNLRRSLSGLLRLALSLGVLALVLLAPSQALAKARGYGCRRAAGTHIKRRGHSCATSRRSAQANRARHAAGHHGARPAGKSPGREPKRPRSSLPPVTWAAVAAGCEDGSAPVQVEAEVYECADGSEPSCEDGSQLTASANGATLLCAADPSASEGSDEVECQGILTLPEGAEGSSSPSDDATPFCSSASEGPEPGGEADE